MKMNHALLILGAALLLGGCAGLPISQGDGTKTATKPPAKTAPKSTANTASKASTGTATVAHDSTRLKAAASKMADAMLSSPAIGEITATSRPVLFMDNISNDTAEQIDTKGISDAMRTRLRQADKFSFADAGKVAAVKQQLEYQQSGGVVEPAAMVRLGKQTGARYMVYGNLASVGKGKYQMSMNLMDLHNGELLWSDQQASGK